MSNTKASANSSREEQAVAGLKRLIGEGTLAAGDRIAENAVAQSLGLSRTPMRAALQSLESEGWVVRNVAGGYFVREFSLRDVLDTIRLRGALERLTLVLAAERGARKADLDELTRLAEAMDVICEDNISDEPALNRLAAHNLTFHQQIWRLADSAIILNSLQRAMGLPFVNMGGMTFDMLTTEIRGNFKLSSAQHHQMIEAIRSGNRELAIASASAHTELIIQTSTLLLNDRESRALS